MSNQSFTAFVKASAYYAPIAQPRRNPRPESAHVSLPSPTPPATRLCAGTGPLPTVEGDPLQKLTQTNLAANYAATAATATTLSETPRLDREASHKQVSRPWRESPPKALNSNSGWKSVKGALLALQNDKISDLVKQRSQVTRQVRDRIQAFDKRVAILSSGGRKVAANESAENNSAGDAGDFGRFESRWFADDDNEADELEGIPGMPFKVTGWSSQRGNFPAFNLLGTSSCWQSEIGKTRDQHLSFEVEDIPAPVVAIQMEVVTKEVTPKRCRMMFSTNSATGPWQTAWTFTVPENVAEKGSTIFYKAKEDMKENAESAPWWRLVILDNYGSQACVAIAAPLKLLVSARGEHMRMKQIKRNTITFLEDSFFAQKHLMSNLTAEERFDRRLATKYNIEPTFIQKAHQHFDTAENRKTGLWTKKDFSHWLLEFLPLKERSKLAPERMTFYWNRLDKDEHHCVDFEEFVIFLQALTSTAAKYSKSIPEFLFPDLVKQAEGFDNLDEEGSKGAVPTPAASNNQEKESKSRARQSVLGSEDFTAASLASLSRSRGRTSFNAQKGPAPNLDDLDMSLLAPRRSIKEQ